MGIRRRVGHTEMCGSDVKFFDTKKAENTVAYPAGDGLIKAACCTPFADAKCSDWPKNCPSTHTKMGTHDAPADSENGKELSDDKFEELCCEQTCADQSVAWLAAQALSQGCAVDT